MPARGVKPKSSIPFAKSYEGIEGCEEAGWRVGNTRSPKRSGLVVIQRKHLEQAIWEWILRVNLLHVVTGYTDTFFHPSVTFFEQINPPQLPLSLPSPCLLVLSDLD